MRTKECNLKLGIIKKVLVIFFLAFILSPRLYSQPREYMGIEGGFGARAFTLKSDISQLDNLYTAKAGGSLGLVYGSSFIKVPLSVGSYSMSIEEKRTIDLLTLNLGANIAMLRLFGIKKSPIEIYVLTNLEGQSFLFAGSYMKLMENEPVKRFYGETVLGKIRMLNANIGLGMEFKIVDRYDFVHIFIEAKKPYLLSTSSTHRFAGTDISNNLAINIGLRIGKIR